MPEYTTIQLLMSLTSICAAYALIMSLLKPQIQNRLVRIVAVLSVVAGGGSLVFLRASFYTTSNFLLVLSIIFLILGLCVALTLVLMHYFKLKKTNKYTPALIKKVRILAILTAVLLTIHLLFEVAAFAWN